MKIDFETYHYLVDEYNTFNAYLNLVDELDEFRLTDFLHFIYVGEFQYDNIEDLNPDIKYRILEFCEGVRNHIIREDKLNQLGI